MKTILIHLFAVCLLGLGHAQLSASDSGILLHSDFDNYNVTAVRSRGKAASISFRGDLQLRMYPGIKGNAITLLGNESCAYDAPGNLSPASGTLSCWVAPLNWKPSGKKTITLLEIRTKGFAMSVSKNFRPYQLLVTLDTQDHQGKNLRHYVRTAIWDLDWPLEKWHKIDVTWNQTSLKLYVDGSLPPPSKPDMSKEWYGGEASKKFPLLNLPQTAEGGFISLNSRWVHDHTDINLKTAFDELTLYDHPLSDAEIRNNYEKYRQSKFGLATAKPLLTIPQSNQPVTPDGTLQPEEWKDASQAPVIQKLKDNMRGNLYNQVLLKHDDQFLYVGANCNWTSETHEQHKNDGRIYLDDSVELHLLSPDQTRQYQFVLNANGAILDAMGIQNENRTGMATAWNAGAKAGARRLQDSWSCELAIPLKALGMTPNSRWTGNVGVSFRGKKQTEYYSWAETTAFGNKADFGELNVLKAPQSVQLTIPTPLKSGDVNLILTTMPGKKVQIKLEGSMENGTTFSFHQKTPTLWNYKAKTGRYGITAEVRDDSGKQLLRWQKFFEVNQPIEFDYICWALRPALELRLDLINIGAQARNLIRKQGIDIHASLIPDTKDNSQPIAHKAFKVKSLAPILELPIPPFENIDGGTYRIRVEARLPQQTIASEQQLNIPTERRWLTEKPGLDHSVPAPWIPVRKLTPKLFAVLDRTYQFDDSPFPVQVTSRGEKLLTSPPAWTLTDNPISWMPSNIISEHPDAIELAGEGTAKGLKVTWKGKLFFDGLYKLDLNLIPTAPEGQKLQAMNLKWSVTQTAGKHPLLPLYTPWDKNNTLNYHIDLVKNPSFCLWTTGDEKGFMWWTESLANWKNKPGERQLHLAKGTKDVNICLNMITQPVTLRKKAAYSMAFMGTPAKRPPQTWRAFNWGFDHWWGPFLTAQCEWGSRRTNTSSMSSHQVSDPQRHQKYIDERRAHGTQQILYAIPAHLASFEPEYNFFYPSFANLPAQVTWKQNCDNRQFTNYPCCAHTAITDIIAWRLNRYFQDFPSVAGVYYDVADVRYCTNREHGCGGVDAFGQTFVSSNAYHHRQFWMRTYKITRKLGKLQILHAHSKFVPVCHVFADYWWPGEQYDNPLFLGKNPEHFYCEDIPLDEYRSGLSPVTHGMGIIMLPEFQKAMKGSRNPDVRARAGQARSNPRYAHSIMAPALLNDIGVSACWMFHGPLLKWWGIKKAIQLENATFHPWWQQKAVSIQDGQQVYCSYYSWNQPAPFARVLIVANLSRKDQKVTLNLDRQKLGIGGIYFYDLWNLESGQTVWNKRLPLTVKANSFRILAIH